MAKALIFLPFTPLSISQSHEISDNLNKQATGTPHSHRKARLGAGWRLRRQ
jgi:hypothetical protein